jgi:hypothetical protein
MKMDKIYVDMIKDNAYNLNNLILMFSFLVCQTKKEDGTKFDVLEIASLRRILTSIVNLARKIGNSF